jgi:hypothetical protein
MRLLQAVRNQATRIASEIEDSNLFTHMGDRGQVRERIVARFLRPFLPPCYGLDSGEVFSADGIQSAQIDIVIYDAIFSTILFRGEEKCLFPTESIFGSIEVKSSLNSNELMTSIENIASLKRLSRPDSDAADLSPLLRMNLSAGLTVTAGKMNPYLGYIFGYQGISPETVATQLNERIACNPAQKDQLPDLIFALHPGYMVMRMGDNGVGKQSVQGPGRPFEQFMYVMTGDDTLPLFYLALNIALGSIRLRSISYQSLWSELFSQVLERARTNP